jgi:O-antigen ligase
MEYLYVLYITSGVIKGFLAFFGKLSSIDFTLLIGSLLCVGLLFLTVVKGTIKENSKSILSIYLLLLFYLWINITIFYSSSSDYSYTKSLIFLTNLLAFVIPLLYGNFNTRKFIKLFVILAPLLGVLFLVFLPTVLYKTTDEAKAFQAGYLANPLLCGVSLLILSTIRDMFPPILTGLLIVVNALVIIICGARGPIIFIIAVLVLFATRSFFSFVVGPLDKKIDQPLKSKGAIATLSLSLVAGICLLILYVFVPDIQLLIDRSFNRGMILFDFVSSGTVDESAMERVNRFSFSYDKIFASLQSLFFGYGLGSYGVMYTGTDAKSYPHNVLLEIWFETGLIGIFAILPFCIYVIYVSRKHISSNPFAWIIFFIILNFMKSGSLVDLRVFFGFLAIMMLQSRTRQQKSNSHIFRI